MNKMTNQQTSSNPFQSVNDRQSNGNNVRAIWTSILILLTVCLVWKPEQINAQAWTESGSKVYKTTDGNVGVGTTNPIVKLDIAGAGAAGGSTGAVITRSYSSTYTDWQGAPTFGIVKSHSNSLGTNATTVNGEVLGQFYFGAVDAGNTTYSSAVIQAVQVGAPGTGPGSIRSSLDFLMATGITYTSALFIDKDRNVGIGTVTPNPASKLHVAGNTQVDGNITVSGNINAKYQDVAEWVESSQTLLSGTVVILDATKNNQVVASTSSYDTSVAGVVSERPGVLLGEGGAGKAKIATTGRVKVRVDATKSPIKIGDLLVTSDIAGTAMKSIPIDMSGVKIHRPGTIVGKALEPLSTGTGEILVLLSLQ